MSGLGTVATVATIDNWPILFHILFTSGNQIGLHNAQQQCCWQSSVYVFMLSQKPVEINWSVWLRSLITLNWLDSEQQQQKNSVQWDHGDIVIIIRHNLAPSTNLHSAQYVR